MAVRKVYDVAIIGAGSVGVPTSMYMAKRKLQVLVLERSPSPGQGSNKAALGGVRATHSNAAKIRLGQRSLEIFSTWEETYGHNINWVRGGYSFLAYREKEERVLRSLLSITESYRLGVNWCDAKALLELIPGLNPIGLLGGTYSPNDGYCSTLLAGHAMYDEARHSGAVFRFNEPVISIQLDANGCIKAVKTPAATYHTPVLLNTGGAWARQIGEMVGLDHPVHPDSHEAGITEPVSRFLGPLVVDLRPGNGSANCYFLQSGTGQILFCYTPDPPIEGQDCRETSAFLPHAAQRLVKLVPRLASVRVRRTWRGLYPMTPDAFPLVGWAKEIPGYLMGIGMCGQGFALGPSVGEMLTSLILEERLSQDQGAILEALSPYRVFTVQEKLK